MKRFSSMKAGYEIINTSGYYERIVDELIVDFDDSLPYQFFKKKIRSNETIYDIEFYGCDKESILPGTYRLTNVESQRIKLEKF
ncbi:hypothetical protein [Bacillus halotolerans]|uniref:hypothetical protein n=1 Tax=Bacillus halotolerans TaxID=260554 RepID=UPI002DBD650A|nr:hypothetical protein [Bacillus halotolerans]MEC1646589.1 hypothetical protein [Bacillus halotolerans]